MSTNSVHSLNHEKPKRPYIKGFTTIIKSHTPPPSVKSNYPRELPSPFSNNFIHKNYVLEYPPLENSSRSDSPQQKADLEITQEIATGDSRGAQLVLCNITPHDSSERYQAVAKIYDALYYKFLGKKTPHRSMDVIYKADSDYTTEAASYKRLQDIRQTGVSVPGYFGSWTFTLPCEGPTKEVDRPVRLILMEYLNGALIAGLFQGPSAGRPGTSRYTEEFRLEVMKKMVEVCAQISPAGIKTNYFPQDLMLVPRPELHWTKAQVPRLVLFDFHRANLLDEAAELSENPENPINIYQVGHVREFDSWVPKEWLKYGGELVELAWLLKCFLADDTKDAYMPVDPKKVESMQKKIIKRFGAKRCLER